MSDTQLLLHITKTLIKLEKRIKNLESAVSDIKWKMVIDPNLR